MVMVFTAVGLVGASAARGADRFWIDSGGGSFQDPGNWNLGVPGPSDSANFNLATLGYTVTFAANVTTDELRVINDEVVLDLGGFVYEVTGQASVGLDGGANVFLEDGTLRQFGVGSGSMTIGYGEGATGALTLRFTTTLETNDLFVGSYFTCNELVLPSAGDLNIENDSTVTAVSALVGVCAGEGGYGRINVRDNASLEISPFGLLMASEGEGYLDVEDNGTVTLAGLNMGSTALSIIDVTGANAEVTVGPGDTFIGTSGQVNINSGGLFDASNSTTFGVRALGVLSVGASGTLRTGDTTIGTAGGGTATVDVTGALSLWEIFGPASIGELAGGTVNIGSGGLVEEKNPNPYIVGPLGDIIVDVGGTLRTGGTVTPGGMTTIGTAAGGTATVLVDGASAVWETFGPVSLGELGPGRLTIESGGLVEHTDPNPLMIGRMGEINVFTGGKLESFDTTVGSAGAGFADIEVFGAGSRWDLYGSASIGETGSTVIDISAGGVVEHKNPDPWIAGSTGGDIVVRTGAQLITRGTTDFGSGEGAFGRVLVSDSGSRYDAYGAVNVGVQGHGRIDVDSGGLVETKNPHPFIVGPDGAVQVSGLLYGFGLLTVGTGPGGMAQVVVSGAGEAYLFNTVSIGELGPAQIIVTSGGTLENRFGDGECVGGVNPGFECMFEADCIGGTCDEYAEPSPTTVGPDAEILVSSDSAWITRGSTTVGTGFVGTDYISPARIQVSGAGARWDNYDALTIGGAGLAHITLVDGGVIEDHGLPGGSDLMLDASIFGSGTLTWDFVSVGRLYPGLSPGTMTITGDYTQLTDGQLIIEIAGSLSGEYDVVDISGTATLDGKLIVERLGGFTPSLGTAFTIITYASRSGTFAAVETPSFGTSGLTFRVDYDTTDLRLTVVKDCDFNGAPDSEDISGCAGDPDCGDCNGNTIPDVCDIDQCDRAIDPDCADCNNNDIPDSCDIASATSQDLDLNGIPDECVFYIGPSGDNNWTTFANWDLGGSDYPDNDAVSFHVTLDGDTADVVLDTDITIDTLNILGRASLEVSGGNLTVVQQRGIEVNGDTPGAARGTLDSDLLINGANTVDAPRLHVLENGRVLLEDTGSLFVAGTLEIGAGGSVSKLPGAIGVAGAINAGTMVINGGSCASNTAGGQLILEDKMSVNVTGDLVMNGSLETDCFIARGGITPPPTIIIGGCGSRSRAGTPTLAVGGNLVLNQNTVVSSSLGCFARGAERATGQVRVTGNFDNRTTDPFNFDWSSGSIEVSSSAAHTFEVSGRDLGPVEEGFAVQGCSRTLTPCGTAGILPCGVAGL